MIWFAWRVQRLYLIVAAAAVAGVAIWFTVQGLHEEAFWNCLLNRIHPAGRYAYCSAAWSAYNFTHWNPFFYWVLYAVPGLGGVLLGSQLVAREFDHKTSRIAWTQSVTRTRWLSVKVLLVGGIIVALAAASVGLAEWWTGAVRAGASVLPDPFDVTGLVPVAYGVFAFLLGTALGAVVKRTGWAVFIAIPLFGLARSLVRFDVRPHLAPTTAAVSPLLTTLGWKQGWALNKGFLPVGHTSPPIGKNWNSWHDIAQTCFFRSFVPVGPNSRMGVPSLDQLCLKAHHLHYVIQYQPQSHYWQLQAEESAMFLVAGLALAVVAFLAVKRRSA